MVKSSTGGWKKAGKVIGTIFLVCFLGALIFFCIFAVYVKNYLTPQLDFDYESFTLNQTSVIYYEDRSTGEQKVLQSLYGSENRIWASFDELPDDLVFATVALEDKRFYKHHGVDWYRTCSAFVNMFIGMRDTFGGSTLTQQLIKNTTKEEESTVRRKLVEIFRALEFEKEYDKDEIMEMYLNTIYFGESSYGVYSASLTYFGKEVSQLSLAECASLISITNNPSIYDPYINPEKNKERQEAALWAMLEQGYITREEYEEAKAEELVFQRGSASESSSTVYSYFVDQVIRDVVNDLVEATGYSSNVVTQMVNSGGYSIYSTVDVDIQSAMEEVFYDLSSLPASVGTYQQLQAGMVIIDNTTGDVVAMCGGLGEKEGSLTLNRAAQSYRSPGSCIKPLAVYGPALDLGLITPATVYDDTPLTYDGEPWPKNYDRTYRGLMTVTEAMAISNNTIPAKIVQQLTPQYCFDYLTNKLGFDLVAAREVSSGTLSDINIAPMALGGLTNGVTVKQMAEAYEAIANSGVYREARTYTKVVDSHGNVILDNAQDSNVAMKEKTSYYLTDMMEAVVTEGTGTDAALSNVPVAGKTGTTTNDYDRWFCGYTPYYCAAVWTGYDSQEEIILEDQSINPAIALWQKVMEKAHEGLSTKDFYQPSSVVEVTYCLDSGLLATELCEKDVRGSRVAKIQLDISDVPTEYCDLHVRVELCAESDQLYSGSCTAKYSSAMLNYMRQMGSPGIVVADQQYTVGHLYSTIPAGYYVAATGVDIPANSYCYIHTEHESEEEEEIHTTIDPGGEEEEPETSDMSLDELREFILDSLEAEYGYVTGKTSESSEGY